MDKQVLKLGARVLENLPDMSPEKIQNWIDDPKGLQRALQKVFSQFNIWKTIKIEKYGSVADLRILIEHRRNRISDWADELLSRISLNCGEVRLDLVKVSVAELDFKNGARLQDIYKRAQELGLQLCPAEVGPRLRLQYQDQPLNEWLRIAMEPIIDSDGDLGLFRVGRFDRGGPCLNGDSAFPRYFWYGYDRFVFVRPRK